MSTTPRILAVIPARKGSKGIAGKNLRMLGGKPLIHHTFQSASEAKLPDIVILSTDCPDIATSANTFPGIHIPFLRPETLGGDEVPTIKVLQHVVEYYDAANIAFDYVCLLQPTSPFRPSGLIDLAIETILTTQSDSLVSMKKVPDKYNPHWVYENIDSQLRISTGEKEIIPRRQELPETFYRDGQIYISSADLIREGKILGENPICFLNHTGADINIDTIEDWKQAEIWIKNGRS